MEARIAESAVLHRCVARFRALVKLLSKIGLVASSIFGAFVELLYSQSLNCL